MPRRRRRWILRLLAAAGPRSRRRSRPSASGAAARAAAARTVLLRFVVVHAADVDAADRHAVGDLVLLRAVVGVGAADREQDDSTTAISDRDSASCVPSRRSSSMLDASVRPGSLPFAKILAVGSFGHGLAAFPAIAPLHGALVSAPSVDIVSPMRTKDEVRNEVWKAMDREGVSRFPGAEGRIPNFAGAKLAAEKLAGHRLWKRARVIKANPDSPQTHARRVGARGGQDGDHGGAAPARPPPLPPARPEASSRKAAIQRGGDDQGRAASTAGSSPSRSCPRSTSSSAARSRSTSAAPGSARAAASPTSSTGS